MNQSQRRIERVSRPLASQDLYTDLDPQSSPASFSRRLLVLREYLEKLSWRSYLKLKTSHAPGDGNDQSGKEPS
jgi:hypothetical protein